MRRYFHADAAFANPEIHDFLEAEAGFARFRGAVRNLVDQDSMVTASTAVSLARGDRSPNAECSRTREDG
jgi:hypothetical protein